MRKNPSDIIRMRIAERMKERRITQVALAQQIGVSESTVFRFLNGQVKSLTAENLRAIALMLGVSSDYLLGLTDFPYGAGADGEALRLFTRAVQRLRGGEMGGEIVSVVLEHIPSLRNHPIIPCPDETH